MTFADYILGSDDFCVISEGTLKVEDLSSCIASVLKQYYDFHNTEVSDILKEYYHSNTDEMSFEDVTDLYESMVNEAEELFSNEGMYFTTAEGDPACLMICRVTEEDDHEF